MISFFSFYTSAALGDIEVARSISLNAPYLFHSVFGSSSQSVTPRSPTVPVESPVLSAPNRTVNDGALYRICHHLGTASMRQKEGENEHGQAPCLLNTTASTTDPYVCLSEHVPAVKAGLLSAHFECCVSMFLF